MIVSTILKEQTVRHSSKIILALAAASFMVAGCESSEEKAERLRLEELYSLDNIEVAKAFNRYNTKPYNDISEECENEKLHKIDNEKWCAKLKIIRDEVRKM